MINKKANSYLVKRQALQKVANGGKLSQKLSQIGDTVSNWWNDPKNEQIRDYGLGIGGGFLGGGILNKLLGGSFLRGGVTGGILGGAGTYAYRNMLGKQRAMFADEEARRLTAENEVNDLTNKNTELGNALNQTNQELAGARNQIDGLTNDNIGLQQQLAGLTKSNQELQNNLAEVKKAYEQGKISLQEAQDYIAQLQSDPTYQGMLNQYN